MYAPFDGGLRSHAYYDALGSFVECGGFRMAEEEAAAEESEAKYGAEAKKVAEHFEEMADIGAHLKGEGSID